MNFTKLAALGAQGAAGGLMAVWAGLLFITRPGPGGGFTPVLFACLAAAALVPVLLLAAAHWWFGWQLKHGPDSIRG